MKKTLTNFLYTKVKSIISRQFPYEVEVIAKNLNIPWAIDISYDGKIYFTERTGSIRVIENGILNPQPLVTLRNPFISQGEGGLMGLVLDPDHAQNNSMYAMHLYIENGQLYNRVIKLVENNSRATIDQILIDKIPGARFHNGGRIKIGPDKKLYITTGDAGQPSLAQDISSTAGKILRLELDGSIPRDNPIPNSPIYSLGHRNPQGLSWNSKGMLYSSEHGQSAHDEINLIIPGANYGWPIVQGDEETTSISAQSPLIHSNNETWAPSGITFISNGPWKDRLLVATLSGQKLLAISFLNETVVNSVEPFLQGEYGRLRDVVEGKDGSIYITTSNRDGRGNPIESDDRIIRLVQK